MSWNDFSAVDEEDLLFVGEDSSACFKDRKHDHMDYAYLERMVDSCCVIDILYNFFQMMRLQSNEALDVSNIIVGHLDPGENSLLNVLEAKGTITKMPTLNWRLLFLNIDNNL